MVVSDTSDMMDELASALLMLDFGQDLANLPSDFGLV